MKKNSVPGAAVAVAVLGLAVLLGPACSSSKGSQGAGGAGGAGPGGAGAVGGGGTAAGGTAGSAGPGGAAGANLAAIVVQPPAADVLTCTSLQLAATVPPAIDPTGAVIWAVDRGPEGGAVTSTGLYSAPAVVPSPSVVAVTATSVADPAKSAASRVTLHEVMPQAPVAIGESSDHYMAPHQMAAAGKNVYAVLAPTTAGAYSLQVAASADGGKTFAAPAPVSDAPNAQVPISCQAIAVDAGDPNTVYVSYMLGAGVISKTKDAAAPGAGATLALAVSVDAGAHWTNYVLESHDSTFGVCPDVASPGPATVAVETPAFGFPTPYLTVYVDASKGAGFAAGGAFQGGWRATQAYDVTSDFHDLAFDNVAEAPRLAGDGKGNLCVAYAGGYFAGAGDGKRRIAVQCSKDAGAHFAAPVDVALEDASAVLRQPTPAFSPGGILAVAYWVDLQASGAFSAVRLGISKDGGKTFAPATTVPTYQLPAAVGLAAKPGPPAPGWVGEVLWLGYPVADGAGPGRLVVDKSCDLGATWAGPVLLNGPEPNIAIDLGPPGMLMVDGRPAAYAPQHADGATSDPYSFLRLAP